MRRILAVDDELVEGGFVESGLVERALVERGLPVRPAMRASPQRTALPNAPCDQQGGMASSNISKANISKERAFPG
jgi:hypothetical protein